jgi:hypothetical protein
MDSLTLSIWTAFADLDLGLGYGASSGKCGARTGKCGANLDKPAT